MTGKQEEALGQVIEFVRRRAAETDRLSSSTRLLEDLGLDGDEAFRFMEEFAEAFAVAPGDFEFHRYFGAEGFNPLAVLGSLFGSRGSRRRPLTILMLSRAAAAGIWRRDEVERGLP